MPWAVMGFLLPLLSGLLYGLSFPPFNLYPLAWVSLVPLFIALKVPGRPFLKGFLAGFPANLMIFFWLWPTFLAAQIGFVTTLGCWLSLAFLFSLYFGVFAWFASLVTPRWILPWAAGAMWVVVEHIRSIILTGFPFVLLSHSQAYNLPLIQLAAVTGAPGLTFIIVAFNTALSQAGFSKKSLRPLVLVAALMVLIYAGGLIRLHRPTVEGKSLKVALLQGNIDQYQKWDKSHEAFIRRRYETLVKEAVSEKPDLIIWPESAVPGWYPNDSATTAWVQKIVSESQTDHLIGAVSERAGVDYNGIFHVGPDGRIQAEYDKHKLVPFGEYIPFGGFFRRWIPYLGQLGIFGAGPGPMVMTVAGVRLSPNVCYEAVFPDLVRASTRAGAQAIVNITNDGWFLNSGAPEQHFVANIFRAVENGLPVIRAANTGISAVIDSRGRLLYRSRLLQEDAKVQALLIPEEISQTPYNRWGGWFNIVCWIVAIAVLLYSRTSRSTISIMPG